MADVSAQLASLIGSRICHDLISPIGAISNGLELLGLSGQMNGPEFDLIADSVLNANARIRFFRIAYGAAGEQMLGRPEIVSVVEDINRASRVQMIWKPAEPKTRSEVRLAFLALQCCETALPYGGTLEADEAGGQWTIKGSAAKLSHDPQLWAHLGGEERSDLEITAATVQFALLPRIAVEAGRRLETAHTAEDVTITF